MSNKVQSYKNNKKKRWIEYQLKQNMLVTCYSNNRLIVIKRVKIKYDHVVVFDASNQRTVLKNQPIRASRPADPTTPVGIFKDQPLDIAEYVELICKCF